MLARPNPLRGRSRQAGVLASPRDEPAYLRVALALQVPLENDRRDAGPNARRLQVGFGRERPFRRPVARHGSETQRLAQRPPLQRQHAPRRLLVVRRDFLKRLAEPLHFVECGATRRDQRETKDVPVRMGESRQMPAAQSRDAPAESVRRSACGQTRLREWQPPFPPSDSRSSTRCATRGRRGPAARTSGTWPSTTSKANQLSSSGTGSGSWAKTGAPGRIVGRTGFAPWAISNSRKRPG